VSGRRGKLCGHSSRRSGRGTWSGASHRAGTEHGAAWDPRKVDMRHGCPDAGPHPNSSLSFGLFFGCACIYLNSVLRLSAVGTLKRYSKALEYEYRVKTAALGTLKRYSIFSLTLYLE
jgi:hypothetical protein